MKLFPINIVIAGNLVLLIFQLKEMDDVDMLTLVIQEMSKEFPTLMETLVHERDKLVLPLEHISL